MLGWLLLNSPNSFDETNTMQNRNDRTELPNNSYLVNIKLSQQETKTMRKHIHLSTTQLLESSNHQEQQHLSCGV